MFDSFPVDKFDLNTSLILKDLPAEATQILSRNKSTHLYTKDQVVFRENSYPSGIYFVETGMVKKYKVDSRQNEYIVYICTPGELMGMQSVLSTERYLDSAAAMEDSEITFIPREDFLEAVDKFPVLAGKLLRILSHEFGVLIHTIAMQAHHSARERLVIHLVNLREKFRKENQDTKLPVDVYISRTDLANMTGTTRETVVRILADLKAEKMIDVSGSRITIQNYPALLKLVRY